MRLGEIVTAAVLAALSIYMMWKSTDLNIGYVAGKGPGGGAWPFWLSAIMLVCTIVIAFNWARRTSPPSRSTEPVLDADGRRMLLQVGGGIFVFVALIDVISIYGAMALFLFYYLWFLGRHALWLALTISIATPIVFFFFFEALMRITLPKGMSFTDPVFNVLYDIIY
ncbi:MAG TPA: tripartite tricarboxylate transporter TctB family protein [Amaricoccus sp.]|uniref:tripartite tricarboxylate transporter TctB family protein n=1 Tax=Amaricoccus sp. TaxID=1872485 RepID=UPI002B59A531|nr:tripartite tricarboxylate transporter TctB family protein [Amaricoccus sp.]HMQ92860.1 tripartite tricarboxylate transporter TctB family protein [Amaricoccus sp.]HMR52877.1 tripartite tricarboxylate transporter TctB family protein [Amaricoccus sp.]HMR60042.1 tripartite tricarboxylate transporter TctB family protein [Amaricoccus sp.]HMT99812.1 tripartite tricarboxylate transporter TctB family protein [Amaricoccus sp.]